MSAASTIVLLLVLETPARQSLDEIIDVHQQAAMRDGSGHCTARRPENFVPLYEAVIAGYSDYLGRLAESSTTGALVRLSRGMALERLGRWATAAADYESAAAGHLGPSQRRDAAIGAALSHLRSKEADCPPGPLDCLARELDLALLPRERLPIPPEALQALGQARRVLLHTGQEKTEWLIVWYLAKLRCNYGYFDECRELLLNILGDAPGSAEARMARPVLSWIAARK